MQSPCWPFHSITQWILIYLLCPRLNLCTLFFMQIVNWRTHLKFPEEAKLSLEAKDLICKLLCNVEQRLGTRGADEIKVLLFVSGLNILKRF